MIINQLNIKGVTILEPENDPPVCTNGDCPESFAVAFELMQAIAGKVEGLRRFRSIERGKNIFNSVGEVCPDLAAVALLEKPFQPPVLEAPDHFEVSVQ
jgi:hypothetical protein